MITAGAQHLWVDCLCINQVTNTEKAGQISKMYECYKNAQKCHNVVSRDFVSKGNLGFWPAPDKPGTVYTTHRLERKVQHQISPRIRSTRRNGRLSFEASEKLRATRKIKACWQCWQYKANVITSTAPPSFANQ
jgi:hypothetical protein